MQEISSVNPFRCRVWDEHDRLEEYITEESCREEIDSFQVQGQLVPALGRRIQGDPMHDVEIIYGARRLFVARHLNVSLLVELRNLSDREAIIAMDIENRQRRDISPYERGRSYARWLAAKRFGSQEDIARALQVSPSKVSRHLRIAQLPSVIVNAFSEPGDICEYWGLALHKAWQDSQKRKRMSERAREIALRKTRPNPNEIFTTLISGYGRQRSVSGRIRDKVICDTSGMPLFRIRQGRRTVALMFDQQLLASSSLEEMSGVIANYLQDALRRRTERALPSKASAVS